MPASRCMRSSAGCSPSWRRGPPGPGGAAGGGAPGAGGGPPRLAVMVKNEPGALGIVSTVIGQHKANIINLRLDTRDTRFHTNTIDVEVHDRAQLLRLMAALRAADAVHSVERI